MKRIYLFFLLFFLISFNLFANSSESEIKNVYALNFFDGINYNSNIVPPTNNEIFVIANCDNSMVVRQTSLYYWALTSEYKADWATRNITITGKLNIKDSKGKVIQLNPQQYCIQYEASDMANTIKIYWGDDAENKYSEFLDLQNKYNESVYNYTKEVQNYDKKIQSFFNQAETNTKTDVFPSTPIPPENFTLLSTPLSIGYKINLPKGNYSIWLEDDNGKIVEDTKKELISFSPVSVEEGFKVFEKNKWTVPTNLLDSDLQIYSTKGNELYFQPYMYIQMENNKYKKLNNPQTTFSNTGEYFINIPSKKNIVDYVNIDNEKIKVNSYDVVQIAGSKLGYDIREIEPGKSSKFEAAIFDISETGKVYKLGKSNEIITVDVVFRNKIFLIFIAILPILGFVIYKIIKILENFKKRGK